MRREKSLIGVICEEFDAPWKYGVLFKPLIKNYEEDVFF